MELELPEADSRSRFITITQSSYGWVIGLFVGLLIAFPSGYYHKHKKVQAKSAVLVAQADANKLLNSELKDKQRIRELSLSENLKSLGLTEDQIEFLYDSGNPEVTGLKKLFTEYLPGKTKWLKGKTVYVPRTDCSDDYVGDEAAGRANAIILEGLKNRKSQQ